MGTTAYRAKDELKYFQLFFSFFTFFVSGSLFMSMKANLVTLKIPVRTHKKVVALCAKRGYKIYVWVSNTLLQAIEKEEKQKRDTAAYCDYIKGE